MGSQLKINRGLLATLFVMLLVAFSFHLDLFSKVAYSVERGRLKADREHLQRIDSADVKALESLSTAFSFVVDVVKPSVVYIESSSNNKSFNRQLHRLFGEDAQPVPSTGTGSGIIYDESGYIITNNHVVEDAESIRVTLADDRQFMAKLIGTDPKTDLALIKINADRLHPVVLGDSERVKVGHIVLAIGSPFRLGHSVSHGIISAIGRSNVNVNIDYQNWIQTDTPINPGNSGGPLINTRGEVIGINTAIATESGGNQGVAFAIPSKTIKRIAAKLRTGKKIVRGYLGVGIRQVNPKIASAYGLEEAGGVLIDAVGKRSPAAKGGLKPEDIILAIDHQSVETLEELQETIADTEPGSDVDLTVWRKGRKIQLTVTVGVQSDSFSTSGPIDELDGELRSKDVDQTSHEAPKAGASSSIENSMFFRELGFEAATVSPNLAKRFRLDKQIQNGALLTRVIPTGEAFAARLRQGQVVIRANDRSIHNVRELAQALTEDAIAKGVRLKIKSGRFEFYTVLQIR